ncbi:hypothetical protein ADM96_15130 [Burkholderia sp. ST111]|nr:hypothetical protein ADM96_15130 [Burkholderia sp. ST111]
MRLSSLVGKRCAVGVGHEYVAFAAHCLHVAGIGRVIFDHAAQAPDRHVEAAIAESEIVAMHEIVDQHARQHFVRIVDENL